MSPPTEASQTQTRVPQTNMQPPKGPLTDCPFEQGVRGSPVSLGEGDLRAARDCRTKPKAPNILAEVPFLP